MISMVKLGYVPEACEWVSKKGAADGVVAISAKESATIRMYRARSGVNEAVREGTAGHGSPVKLIGYNHVADVAVSIDDRGMVEYWDPETLEFPDGKVADRNHRAARPSPGLRCCTPPSLHVDRLYLNCE